MATGVRSEGKIESVTVYARGAAVRRRAALPADLADGPCDVIVGNVTALADAGTLRASVEGAREVLGVRAELVVPERAAADVSLEAKHQEARRRKNDLVAERDHAVWRRDLLASVQPEPDLVRRVPALDPADRIGDALAVVGLAGEEMAALDAKIADLAAAIEAADREVEAARVAAAQATAAQGKAGAPPELAVVVSLGPKLQGPAPSSVEIEYAVPAARWWPAYRARFTDGATKVSLALAALVAQSSGEDWTGVRLLLSTGDMMRDVRLPEATSLRLGRAQTPRARGYRAPPEGLDAMFEGFDRFVALVSVTTTTVAAAAPVAAVATISATTLLAAAQSWPDEGGAYDGHTDDEPTAVGALHELQKKRKIPADARIGMVRPAAPPAPMPSAGPAPAPGFGGAGPMQGLPMPAPKLEQQSLARPQVIDVAASHELESAPRGRLPAPRKSKGLFSLGDGLHEEETLASLDVDALEAPDGLPIEPADAWLDFDTLRLDPGAAPHRRGRLARGADPFLTASLAAASTIEGMEAPAGTIDPRASRGLFDALYTASATADVPSNGRPHRVTVATADGPATPRFVTVPREAQEVYRRADVTNPFGVPLLTGPVEVLIDGALAALTRLSYTDRGGVISIGLGVEERIRVARNARADEGTAGLLGGTTTMDHAVSTELSSSLGHKITVEVLDRLPISDSKDVEVKLVAARPQPQPYTQVELGQPLRKGLRWDVEVPAGGKAKIEHSYRITLPSKMEIVGGNRRE